MGKMFDSPAQFSGRSLYPNLVINETTAETAKPEPAEQVVMQAEGMATATAGVPKSAITLWFGVLLLFIVLFSIGGGSVGA